MNELGYKWNQADPCLYYKWDETFGLIVWLSFIDDMMILCGGMPWTQEKVNKNC